MEAIITGVISGVISGLIIYTIQYLNNLKKEQKENLETNRVGGKTKKFLDRDFLSDYEPGKVSIQRVFEELGKPLGKYEDFNDNENTISIPKYIVYKYKFSNAIVLFATLINEDSVISLTLMSTDNTYPIKCPLSPASENDLAVLGKAKIDTEIINDAFNSWHKLYRDWEYSAIQSRFFYRNIKHLTFTYIVYDSIESNDCFLGKTIDQICISQIESIHPIIYYYEPS